jgi:hypothetical protein
MGWVDIIAIAGMWLILVEGVEEIEEVEFS